MKSNSVSRRSFLVQGGAAIASVGLLNYPWPRHAFALRPEDVIIPWLDQRAENPVPQIIANQQTWEGLGSWITPNDRFFSIAHYNRPEIDASEWHLEISGLVQQPLSLSLDDLKAMPRQEVTFTLECSGSSGLPFFDAGIGNVRWTGTALAPLLESAGILNGGSEVVFVGTDAGEETVGEQTIVEHFARSMSVEDAMHPDNLLAYEMNGDPLPHANGYPLRLIAPGWYGIANVKWLKQIEVWDTRLQNRFMARDYVTVRNRGTQATPDWVRSSVGRGLLKSAPGRVVQTDGGYRIEGAAWGAPIASVEVKDDDGDWQPAQLDDVQRSDYAWTFWWFNWAAPEAGEHTITSRAIDAADNVQPAPDDPLARNKVTYWESNGQITRRVRIGQR